MRRIQWYGKKRDGSYGIFSFKVENLGDCKRAMDRFRITTCFYVDDALKGTNQWSVQLKTKNHVEGPLKSKPKKVLTFIERLDKFMEI